MTKIINFTDNAIFDTILKDAKFERMTDISFGYRYEDKDLVIDFYQDEQGKNHLDEFSVCKSGFWFPVTATDYQLKAMFKKLNETSLAFEPEIDNDGDEILDLYDHYGVKPENFY